MNEKGALDVVDGLPLAPPGFGASARAALAHAGGTPEELEASIRNVAALVRAVAQEAGRH